MTGEEITRADEKIAQAENKYRPTAEIIAKVITVADPPRSSRASVSFLSFGAIIAALSTILTKDVHLGLAALL